MKALKPQDFLALKENSFVLDAREMSSFLDGFIPNSIFITNKSNMELWARNFVPTQDNILLIVDANQEAENIASRLKHVGFNNILGFLDGGIKAWKNADLEYDLIVDIEADELVMDLPHDKKLDVIDVREENEFTEAHIQGAISIPLSTMNDVLLIADLNDEHNLYVHCGGGTRAAVAASLLKKHGLERVRIISGGFKAIQEVPNAPIEYKNKA